MSVSRRVRTAAPLAFLLIASSLAFAPAVAAHAHQEVGEYGLTIGWAGEPTFVGQPNAVELTIDHHETEEPVADLEDGDLTVIVSTAGQETAALPLSAAFGSPGVYEAEVLPTVPGEYTFHFVGTIHDQAVDVSITSGEDTFSPVRASTEVEFPVKVPTLADVATRLDRVDGRIEEVQAAVPNAQILADLQTAASDARNAAASAERTALIGILVGGAGVLFAVVSLWVAIRIGRRGAGTA